MPRFSLALGRRKSTADNLDNDVIAEPSFRVLDRAEIAPPGKSFDGGAAFVAAKSHSYSKHSVSDIKGEDNMFADLKPHTNRYVFPSPPLPVITWVIMVELPIVCLVLDGWLA